jgi:RNA polymerase sigma-70 factor (ECF subfamily)
MFWSAWEWLIRPLHYRAVRRLRTAAEAGDLDRIRTLLDPTISVVVESGGDDSVVRVVQGVHDAAALLAHGFAPHDDVRVEERSVNSQAGLMMLRSGRPIASVAVDFTGHLVSVVWVKLRPAGLRNWNTVYA